MFCHHRDENQELPPLCVGGGNSPELPLSFPHILGSFLFWTVDYISPFLEEMPSDLWSGELPSLPSPNLAEVPLPQDAVNGETRVIVGKT